MSLQMMAEVQKNCVDIVKRVKLICGNIFIGNFVKSFYGRTNGYGSLALGRKVRTGTMLTKWLVDIPFLCLQVNKSQEMISQICKSHIH